MAACIDPIVWELEERGSTLNKSNRDVVIADIAVFAKFLLLYTSGKSRLRQRYQEAMEQ
jgi:DNA-binding ferritin-like protein (Dps family)